MKLLTLLFVLSIIYGVICDESHQKLELDTPYQKELAEMPFVGRYIFNIKEEQVKKLNSEKWFFFVELEPNEDKQWISTDIELSVGKKDSEESTKAKNCDARLGGVDSCFLTNKQFKYSTQQVHVRVRCRGPCKFKLSGQISAPFKIEPGSSTKMDFQDTAYSKIFTLDTTKNENFDQLRIILKPQGFLQFPAPIGLYLNQDDSIPTKQKHDMKGMTLWDNGQGIFLDLPDAKGFFTILIEGPEKNVLILETQLISFLQTNQIKSNLPFFDYLGAQSSKKYKVKVNPAKGVCFQMTTFSGAIQLLNVYDENGNEIEQKFPPLFRTYSQLEYQIDAQFFKENKDNFNISNYIIFEVGGVKQSTFVIEPYDLNPSISHLIHDRTRYVDLPGQKYHQYYIEIVELNIPQFKKAQFEIVITTEESRKINTRFFNCKKEHGNQCQLKNSEVSQKTINNKDIAQINSYSIEHQMDGVEIYKFTISSNKFVKSGEQTKKYILTVLIENSDKQAQQYTIQYISSGKNIYLKEGQVQKDRVAMDEIKYYVFTNTNTEVEEIRVHVMEISGRVFMEGYLEDPRKKDLSGQQISDYHNSVRYEKVKQNQTIYLKIEGKENAYYSIQLQLVKESERQWWNRTHSNNGKGYNEIILVEDIPYEFNIQAKSKEVFQLHSKNRKFNLDISSLLPLELCMTEQLKKPPFPPNCEEIDHLTKNKFYQVTLEKGNRGNIGVTNNNDKDVKFNIRFTSPDSVKPIDNNSTQVEIKCLPGILGKINKFNFKKDTSSCYSYFIDKPDDLEVIIDIISDEYEKVNVLAQVNSLEKVEIIGATHIFKKEQIKKACGETPLCPIKLFIDSKIDTQIRFTTQFLAGTFYLLDGIANQFTGTKESRHFVYELYNKVNTTVVLENRNGFYKFYGKVIDGKTYWSGNFSFPTAKDKVIESANPFYYQYQISILAQKQIKASLCTECLLLLTVVREEQTFNPNQKSRFVIECTQEQRFLKENQPIVSFLGKRSMAFYEFYNTQNGSLLVSINTQNQECIQTFIKKGVTSRASGSDFDKKSQSSNPNRIILQQAVEGEYSIAVEAIEDCSYSIDVTTAANETLGTIEQGIYKDISLDKDEVNKFVYENRNDDEIKVLTLHENGQITINVKAYPDVKALMADNLKKPKYQWSGKDFLKIDKNDKNYCVKCIYLVVVTADRQTKTSIMIPSRDSEFPIVMDSSIKDELKKGEIETLRIFTQKSTEFEVNVQYGEINIDIISSNNNEVFFTKTFSANESTRYQNITNKDESIGGKTDYTFMRYNKVKITAIKDSGFTFGFISSKDESKRGSKIKYGIPEYVTLSSKKRQCLRGTLDDDKEQFLISITGDKQLDLMNNLEISCEVNKVMLELQKNIAKNQMIVTYNKAPKTLPAPYEFCMVSKDEMFLTFIQSSKLNYFPENQIIMVSKQMNLSFYAEGRNLIEINECTSRAITTISHSFNNIGGLNSQVKQIRKSNNIIEFSYYGPVYVNVKADSATLSWRKKDELTKLSFGYDEYTNNKIRIDKEGNKLLVEVFPLKMIVEKPKVSFTSVEYSAYLAEEEMNLYDAMNCNNGKYLSKSIASNTEDKALTLSFQVDQIIKSFSTKKYVLIGILATATSNITNDQKYRFVYPYQQLLIQGLSSGGNLQKVKETAANPLPPPPPEPKSSWFNTFVIYFTLVVVLVFVAIWVYRKWIRNLLRKHKRQQLSEQGTGEVRYQEFTSYT